jgi:lysozyme
MQNDKSTSQDESKETNTNKITRGILLFGILFSIGLFMLIMKNSSSNNHINRNAYPLEREMNAHEKLKVNNVLSSFVNHPVGIDLSHFQGRIKWGDVGVLNDSTNLDFVVLRATMGSNSIDNRFVENWNALKDSSISIGAYHYYRPNENSTRQANNYINNVKLTKGNMVPILDIEQQSSIQPMSLLRRGLLNWLKIIEKHYGVKPIIYTGDNFYNTFLNRPEFNKYQKWIANYNYVNNPKVTDWSLWQFSDAVKVNGINELVDLNVFNGDKSTFRGFVIQN